jgi:hypothetical protein
MDEWTDKNGDVYKLDTEAPEGVVRYVLAKAAKKSKAKKSGKNASTKKGN